MKNKYLLLLTFIIASVGLAYVLSKKRIKNFTARSTPYPKNFLGEHIAKNAVTGGHPEEMNGMPPVLLN